MAEIDKSKGTITWSDVSTGGTPEAVTVNPPKAVAATLQISGTFGGATAKLQASNDGSTYFDITDTQGNAVSATADAMFEVTTKAVYLKPTVTGGTSDAVTFILAV